MLQSGLAWDCTNKLEDTLKSGRRQFDFVLHPGSIESFKKIPCQSS
uniref:Uncharacterized protein n=1 Tax=Anguilla anguilla TaxID=7936 RepID=A0A0E9QRK1_ANGAN